jgi:autotransporter-associated beta strand protein
LVLDRSDNLSVNNALAGQGALVKTSSDTVTLTGNLTGFSGPIAVAQGQLVLASPAAPATTAAYTANGGTTLTFQNATFPMNFASISAMSGGTIQYSNATITNAYLFAPSFGSSAGMHVLSASTTNTFTDVTINAGTPIQIQQNGSALFTNVANYGMINAASGGLVLAGGRNDGGGALTLGGTNNASNWGNGGTITILNGGLLNNQNSDLTSWGGRITINSGGALNADSAAQGASLDLQDSLLVNNGTILGTTNVGYLATVTGSGAFGPVNLSNSGTLDLIAENANLSELTGVGIVNHSGTGSNTLTVGGGDFSSTIENTRGKLTLLKTGSGELILSGSDDYTGGTDVEAGTLVLDSNTALLSGSSLTVGANATSIFGASEGGSVPNVTAATAVPEPGTLMLLAFGALGLLARALRRRPLPWRIRHGSEMAVGKGCQ